MGAAERRLNRVPHATRVRTRVQLPAWLVALVRFGVAPGAIYLAVFCALSYPLIGSFSSRFFTDAGDGLQSVWNLWWVIRAVTELHTWPWFTSYLHYPDGVSLVGHTLNPFNGLVAIALLRTMTLVQAHNTLVVFAFVMGGVGAFWLAYTFCHRFWPSMLGGAVFTFSQYHFEHTEGHLQLVSLEWLPVFALAWNRLLRAPSVRLAVASALALLLVLLCDYYYFGYAVVYAVIAAAWEYRRNPAAVLRMPFAAFGVAATATCAPLIVELLYLNATDPLLGSHDPDEFSTDLLGAILPGGHWRFAELTASFWSTLPGNINESSVDVGVGVLGALAALWWYRRRPLVRAAGPWWLVLAVFWMLSLGPTLHVWGEPLSVVPMPYHVLQKVAPVVSLSGVPARMMVMVFLAAGVLTAVSFSLLSDGPGPARRLAVELLLLICVEYLPGPLPSVSPPVPDYVLALRDAPSPGAVLDLVSGYSVDRPFGSVSGVSLALYYQTLHARPMAAGYIARLPRSAWLRLQDITRLVDERNFAALCAEDDLRYVVLPAPDSIPAARVVFVDRAAEAEVFDLAPGGRCL